MSATLIYCDLDESLRNDFVEIFLASINVIKVFKELFVFNHLSQRMKNARNKRVRDSWTMLNEAATFKIQSYFISSSASEGVMKQIRASEKLREVECVAAKIQRY